MRFIVKNEKHAAGSVIALLLAWSLALPAAADIRLPAVIGNNMVVQADADVVLWGWANPGERIKALGDWGGHGGAGTADKDGKWRLTLRTPAYGEKGPDGKPKDAFKPHTITLTGTKHTLTLENVLLGEVWVCSGQSNMEMPLGDHGGGYRGVLNWKTEKADADHPAIRLFDVQNRISFKPEDDCTAAPLGGKAGWVACSPDAANDFSATGYFFGVELSEALGVPVGLIGSNWGGTPAEAWTSEEGLASFPEYAEPLAWMKSRRAADATGSEPASDPMQAWWEQVDALESKSMGAGKPHWRDTGFDDSAWSVMKLPATWEGDMGSYDGLAWFRRTVVVPEEWKGRELTLELGPIDDMDATYFDGTKVGGIGVPGQWGTARVYKVPANLATPGTHLIAVRVYDAAGPGGINGTPEQMVLKASDGSGRPIPLSGYWKYATTLKASELPPIGQPAKRDLTANTPSALYNGMIAPLTPMTIRGAIWYQGESNRGAAARYAELFPAMIKDWRTHWGRGGGGEGGDFPFYFVQIAPFRYGGDKGETATLRDSQRKTLALPNTGMAVTMDIGNPDDIHPKNKQDVGRRLALWALAKTYGKSGIEYTGPMATSAKVQGRSVRVKFDHAKGLVIRGGEPATFEIAGPDGTFAPATATVDGDSVVVTSSAVSEPKSVRYAWCNECVPVPNLFNDAELPAVPFVVEAR